MPPEPIPWGDRKESYKERKHERSDFSSYSFGPPQHHQHQQQRWREMPSPSGHYGSSRYGGSNDFRRPFGHGKQGGRHLYGEESGRGYVPSRSVDKMLEEEACWQSVSRRDGKYGSRYSRDNSSRGSFSQRAPRGSPWEMSNGYSNTYGQLHDAISVQRSCNDTLISSSSNPSHSNHGNNCDQPHLKSQGDNNLKMDGVKELITTDKDDWKVLKWSRSGSLSSRGSGFSHSSSSKSLGGVDSSEAKIDLQLKNATVVLSSSGDVTACVTSVPPSEEMISRKKPRLGWGEGLAKYEKKKVEVPDLSSNKDEGPDLSLNKDECPVLSLKKDESPDFISKKDEGPDLSTNKDEAFYLSATIDEAPDSSSNKDEGVVSNSNADKGINCQSSSLSERSPQVMASLDCVSPATPSSVACSSSPGVEDKLGKAVNVDNNASNFCGSPSIGSQGHLEGFSFNLEKLDLNSMANLSSLLSELLHSDDSNLAESCFMKSTAMSKLLIWKGDVSKALEMTETEIDLLDNELKALKQESKCEYPCPAASNSSVPEVGAPSEQKDVSTTILRPSPLQVSSCGDEMVEKKHSSNCDFEDARTVLKDSNSDSPGTATSKFVGSLPFAKESSSLEVVTNGQSSENSGAVQATSMGLKCIEACMDVDVLIEAKGGSSISCDVSLLKDEDDRSCSQLLTTNKETACKAFEVFSKLLPSSQSKVDKLGFMNASSVHGDALVREKLARRKHFIRFKQRVIALKFKAFQHLWKEDVRLLYLRRHNTKSQKKWELNLRMSNGGAQKHRSTIRSRFVTSGAAGNLSLVPTSEILNCVSELLSDSQVKHCRNALKMPAFILDRKERMASHFPSNNGLVEDPCAVEKERAMINPWTVEEREIFMDKFAAFGKDFRKIASFLEHKTTGDCVEFYYKNHKSDCFEKIKNRKQAKTTSNYLVPSGNKWNRDMNSASLDILGAASVMVNYSEKTVRNQRVCSGRIFLGSCEGDGIMERKNICFLRNEREAVAADVLAGICASVSSEAVSSCITTTVDPGESYRGPKYQKRDFVTKWPSTSDVIQSIDEETCSDESCEEMDPSDWTDEEKSIFLQAVSSYGKDFGKISRCVRTRSRDQCKVFFSKARKCLGLDSLYPRLANLGTPTGNNSNGGGSDGEDACAVETGSVVSDDKLAPKIDENFLLPAMNMNKDDFDGVDKTNLQADLDETENKVKGQSDQETSKAVETLPSYASCYRERTPVVVDGFDSKDMNDLMSRSTCMDGGKFSDLPTKVEVGRQHVTTDAISAAGSSSVLDVVTPGPSSSGAVVEGTAVAESSTNGSGSESQPLDSFSPQNSLSGQNGLILDSNIMVDLGTRKKQGQESDSKDDCLQQHSCLSQNGFADEFTRGCPLQVSTKREMNEDTACGPVSEGQSLHCKQSLAQNCFLQKCNSPLLGIPILSQCGERQNKHSIESSGGLSDVEKPCRNGDFKLFGRILSTPTCTQEPISSSIVEEKGTSQHKPKTSILNFKTGVVNFEDNNYRSVGEAPTMSNSFGDMPRIRSGFIPEADSTKLMSKYPEAFSNHKMFLANMEQQQALQGVVVNSNDRNNPNGIPIFHPMGISAASNGVADYSMLPTFTQQRRVTYVGRGGTHVAGVLDPVSALQIELAKAKQYGVQNGSTFREEYPWTSKDIGR